MDIRDEAGNWLGVTEWVVEGERPYLDLAVVPQMAVSWPPVDSCEALTFQKITLHLAKWQERGTITRVWRVNDCDRESLTQCSRVYLKGATCETEYGRYLSFVEMLARLLLALCPCSTTVH